MDGLSVFFLVCFVFGTGFALLSLALGWGHGLHLGGHDLHLPDIGHASHGLEGAGHAGHVPNGAHADAGHGHGTGHASHGTGHASHGAQESVSPVNLSTIMAFLAAFGGIGLIVQWLTPLGAIFSLGLGALAGLLGGWTVLLFLSFLVRSQASENVSGKLEGTLAQVSIPILPGRTGEIIYAKGGTRRSDGARSIDDEPIPRGTEVVIVRVDKGLAYVQTWDRFTKEE